MRPVARGRGRRAPPAPPSPSTSVGSRRRATRRRPRPRPDPDPHADAVRVAVLAGGRSSEHDVSLNSAAAVREGVAAAGHEVVDVTIERAGDVALRRRGAVPAPRRRAAGRRRRLPGPARPVRRGRHGPGPARAAGRALRRRGRARLLAVHGQGRLQGGAGRRRRAAGRLRRRARARAGGPSRRPCSASWPCSARPCSSSPPGWAPPSGIAKVWSESELGPALDAAFAHDSLVIVEGFSSGIEVECSVLGNGEPDASMPGEIVLTGVRLVRLRGQVPAGRHGAGRARPAAASTCWRRSAGWPATRSCASAAPGLARVDFFVEDGERVLVNELNTLPGLHGDERLPEAVGGDRRAVPGAVRPAARAGARALRGRARRRVLNGKH